MRFFHLYAFALPLAAASGITTHPAQAATLCTTLADAESGLVLVEQGHCKDRVTPASTFKIALAVMGYDSGFLQDATHPVLPFREGYPDWGGAAWKQPVDPTLWLKHSVVWYSQQITKTLGSDTLHAYATTFGYGNADVSGDPGRDNGLERAWIASSLKISPVEQLAFLRKLVNGILPASPKAIKTTMEIVETTKAGDGWTVHGKTGTAYPRRADGSFDQARAWGWFVGWADKGGRRVVFARLIQDEQKTAGSAGQRAREALISEFPGLAGER